MKHVRGRKPYGPEVHEKFWRHYRQHDNVRAAARHAGISHVTGHDWINKASCPHALTKMKIASAKKLLNEADQIILDAIRDKVISTEEAVRLRGQCLGVRTDNGPDVQVNVQNNVQVNVDWSQVEIVSE